MSGLRGVAWKLAVAGLLLLVGSAVGMGQPRGKIVGRVVDQSGNPLPAVNVVVVGTPYGAATDLEGYYAIVNVPPGVYELRASMIGYATVVKRQVEVNIEQVTHLDFVLQEQVIEGQEVVVVAERDVLHREISNTQLVVEAADILQTAGVRTVSQFMGTQAGVTDERYLTIRGGSPDQTGTLVDGMAFVNPRLGKAETTIPVSAIEQISLQAGGFSAEYGNFRSGILNVVTKAGSRDRYHGTVNLSKNKAHMKRFGKSLYDPTNWGLRPYMDPLIAFVGTDQGWLQVTGGDTKEADYLRQQHETFQGWNKLAENYNKNKPPAQQVTPMDLYLWSAWMHMAIPDFAALERLYPQYTVNDPEWGKKKKAIIQHAHEPEGSDPDWDVDVGFGGPVPLIGRYLGNATFYVANKTNFFTYVQPVMRKGEYTSTTMAALRSNLSSRITLRLNGTYRKVDGTQAAFPSDGAILDIERGGDTMPINNLGLYYNAGGAGVAQYWWHPTFWQPKYQRVYLAGATMNYVVSPTTFWDLTLSYYRQKDYYHPKETRNHTPIIHFGPVWVDEMPYGIVFKPDTVRYDPSDPSKFFAHNEYEAPYGLSRRFSSKTGEFHENSITKAVSLKWDLSSQLNRYHFLKSGVEFRYHDINNWNWRWWEGHDTIYEMKDRRRPWWLGLYVQDQISIQGMEARLGLRFDYYSTGGGLWPTGDPYNKAAFTKGSEANNLQQLRHDLETKNVVWTRWNRINSETGGQLLKKTKNYYAVSPRLGISFPVTERSKFFFNYGHFRSPVAYPQLFMYKMRFFKQGMYELGNPNLEPPRTIAYELGVAYNLLDQYLIELSTYYKDVTGEPSPVNYVSIDGSVSYTSYLNNRWENDQGFELRITKRYGDFLTGWVNFWYVIDKNGYAGRRTAYQDEARNKEATAYYAGEENTPQLLPRLNANISFHTPANWGPQFLGQRWLANWLLTTTFQWRRGAAFTHNPAGIRHLQNNLRWPDYYMVDMKVSKGIRIAGVYASLYLDVKNVFNLKVNLMSEGWCFRNAQDRQNYLNSLHLPMYSSPEYDKLRQQNPGLFQPGNDKVGDLRSKDKRYINDPDLADLFLYGYPRDVWFGIEINF